MIEIQKKCINCNTIFTTKNKRKIYCLTQCKRNAEGKKNREYNKKMQRKYLDKKAIKTEERTNQCGICKKWYKNVKLHINYRHN